MSTKNTTKESSRVGEPMDIVNDFKNPSNLLVAFLDSINKPTCIIDDNGNSLLNNQAKELKKRGFDIDIHSSKIKKNTTATITHKGTKYNIEKKDINHGTNSCVCTVSEEDETIARLTESSAKLKKVLSVL
jgi:hypothetical protein